MSTVYTHKMVDGVAVPLSPAEIAECEQREQAFINNPPIIPPGAPALQDIGGPDGSV